MKKKTVPYSAKLLTYFPYRYQATRVDYLDKGLELIHSFYPNDTDLLDGIFGFTQDRTADGQIMPVIADSCLKLAPKAKGKSFYSSIIKKLVADYYRTYSPQVSGMLGSFLDEELRLLCTFESFKRHNKNIFQFSDSLCELFWDCSVENVEIAHIKLPFKTIYLHFGSQPYNLIGKIGFAHQFWSQQVSSLLPYQPTPFEGAWVSHSPKGDLSITLTATSSGATRDNWIDALSETALYQLEISSKITTIQESLLNATSQFIQAIDLAHRFRDSSIYSDLVPLNVERSTLCDWASQSQQTALDCLKLVINGLLFLQSYPEKIVPRYPEDAPVNLVKQIDNPLTSATLKRLAQAKLEQSGYHLLHWCSFPEMERNHSPRSTAEVSNTVGTAKSPHKRRSHRRQYMGGPGRKQLKFAWVKESVIHPELYNSVKTPYRIYQV